jgi:hypothetical protein
MRRSAAQVKISGMRHGIVLPTGDGVGERQLTGLTFSGTPRRASSSRRIASPSKGCGNVGLVRIERLALPNERFTTNKGASS